MILLALLALAGTGLLVASRSQSSSSQSATVNYQNRVGSPIPGTVQAQGQPPTLASLGGGPNTSAMVGMSFSGATAGLQLASGLGANISQSALKAVPIVGTIAGIGLGIYAAVTAHHRQAVQNEANKLDAAVPLWRQYLYLVTQSYSQGQITAQQAVTLVSQAKADYYKNVSSITRGKAGGGDSVQHYLSFANEQHHAKFAPVDPCNAACYIAYYYVEPESQIVAMMLAQAEKTGSQVAVKLQSIPMRPPAITVPEMQLVAGH